MATFDLSNKVNIVNPSANVDAKYGPWASLSEAKTNVVLAVREKGLTVGIIENKAVVEYWWKTGTADGDLVLKTGGSSGDGHTHTNKAALDKIGESGGLPLWDNGAWPGGGGGVSPTSDNVDAALQGYTEGTPTGDSYIPFIGKVKAKLSAVTTVIGTLLTNTFAAKTHEHTKSDITDFPTIPAAYVHPNHSGDVTSVADGATTIAAKAVTLAKMADIATASILGRKTALTGVPEVLNKTDVLTLLNVQDGANNYTHPTTAGNKHIPSGGASGQVLKYSSDGTAVWGTDNDTIYTHPTDDGNKHVPATGTNNSGKVLTAGATAGAMTWETPASVTPADNSITNAKLSKTIVAGRIKGSKTSGDGSIEDLTPAEALELIGAKPATYNGEYAEVIHELPQNITTNQTITLVKNSINVITDFGGSFTLGTAAVRIITLALPADTAGFEQYIVYMKIGATNTVTVVQPSPNIYMTGSLIFQTNTTYKLIYDRFKTGTSTTAVALSFSKVS